MKAHGESERDEFPVAVFYPDGTHSYITRWVSPREALTVAMVLARDRDKIFDRIIVTDGGDDTVFCWEHGKGIALAGTGGAGEVTLEVWWQPTVRMRWLADDGRNFGDNVAFRDWFLTRSRREQHRICLNSGLDVRQCYRMWRFLGRTDKPPRSITIELSREDFEKMFPPQSGST